MINNMFPNDGFVIFTQSLSHFHFATLLEMGGEF